MVSRANACARAKSPSASSAASPSTRTPSSSKSTPWSTSDIFTCAARLSGRMAASNARNGATRASSRGSNTAHICRSISLWLPSSAKPMVTRLPARAARSDARRRVIGGEICGGSTAPGVTPWPASAPVTRAVTKSA